MGLSAQADLTEPIADDEVVLRRIPVKTGWVDASIADDPVSLEAFRPNRKDSTGISLTRRKFRTASEDAASGRSPHGYFVAVLRVGDLRAAGVEVVPTPSANNPGHCEVPQLRAEIRDSDEAYGIASVIASELIVEVEGPFPGGGEIS